MLRTIFLSCEPLKKVDAPLIGTVFWGESILLLGTVKMIPLKTLPLLGRRGRCTITDARRSCVGFKTTIMKSFVLGWMILDAASELMKSMRLQNDSHCNLIHVTWTNVVYHVMQRKLRNCPLITLYTIMIRSLHLSRYQIVIVMARCVVFFARSS